ncbi:hypothetical protein GGQ84_000621 [Desulfitispora alkaliphila]|uniref:metallophosphoesterase n=1 Tax=Desulfitispora alkaliphila TaxID=622674 RepID=UPI003D1C8BBA
MFFLLILMFILIVNISWYVISDNWLRQGLAQYPRARKLTRLALTLWMLIVFIPVISMLIPAWEGPLGQGPWIWISLFYIWMGAIIFWMSGFIPLLGIRKLWERRRKEKLQEVSTDSSDSSDLSRRQLLRLGLVATPPLIVGGGAAASWVKRDTLNVHTRDLPVKNLPSDLEGFTITQLSDIHIGMLTGRERVDRMVEAANRLNSEIQVVTGDILDQDFAFMPDLVETMSALEAPKGTYLCIGNHDKIYSSEKWVRTVREVGLNLLLNEATLLETGGTPIKLMGIDFSREYEEDFENVKTALESLETDEQTLEILLAHHSHAFDAACAHGVPVTLAGHTHGGQLVMRLGDLELANPGRILFKYVDGIYRGEKGETLFVHRGSGDWFPLRTGVPTEVVQLRLVKG